MQPLVACLIYCWTQQLLLLYGLAASKPYGMTHTILRTFTSLYIQRARVQLMIRNGALMIRKSTQCVQGCIDDSQWSASANTPSNKDACSVCKGALMMRLHSVCKGVQWVCSVCVQCLDDSQVYTVCARVH